MELSTLKLDNFFLENGEARVRFREPKTNHNQCKPISLILYENVKEYYSEKYGETSEKNKPIFDRKRCNFIKFFNNKLSSFLQNGGRVTSHMLRKTRIS